MRGRWGRGIQGGGHMKRFVLVGVVLATLFALASPAAARHTTCTDTLTGAVPGDVIVPEGESCIITNATVGDDVKVGEGAFVEVRNSQIADDVKANRSDGIFIDTGTTVG